VTWRAAGCLGVVYSTAAASAVAEFVASQYDLPGPLECSLLNRGFNDSFAVRASNDARYVLRLSGKRRHERSRFGLL